MLVEQLGKQAGRCSRFVGLQQGLGLNRLNVAKGRGSGGLGIAVAEPLDLLDRFGWLLGLKAGQRQHRNGCSRCR